MSKETIYKDLQIGDRFEVAFPDGIPANSNIDKSKTALGMTHDELLAKRPSLIVEASVPIIEDKCSDKQYKHLKMFPVIKGVTPEMVAEYLLKDNSYAYKKILVTPESFGKVIHGAASIGKLQWLYDTFFCLFDESHCFAVHAFREDILKPLAFFDEFKSISMGSATPFPYTHQRFKRLQSYKIRYSESFGTVKIIDHQMPETVLNHFLTHPELFPGKVHIFFNSARGMGRAIITAGVNNVAVHCRNEERNLINLDEASIYFVTKPEEGNFKKFNFYSCRYNEGWNLNDDETATMILYTDVDIPHTLVGIPYTGFQAIGRLRTNMEKKDNKPHGIYHITNNFGKPEMTSLEEIQHMQLFNAELHIDQYNEHQRKCKEANVKNLDQLLPVVKPFVDFEDDIAVLNEDKLDQVSCAHYTKEMYNNLQTISKGWNDTNYNTQLVNFDLQPIVRVKMSQRDISRQVVHRIIEWKTNPHNYVFEMASASMAKYRIEFELLFQALEILGLPKIEELDYDDKAMKAALITISNNNADAQLRKKLIDTFVLGESYTRKYIKRQLQGFYKELNIQNPKGGIKTAVATQLEEYGIHKLREDKVDNFTGKGGGFEVVKVTYSIKQAV